MAASPAGRVAALQRFYHPHGADDTSESAERAARHGHSITLLCIPNANGACDDEGMRPLLALLGLLGLLRASPSPAQVCVPMPINTWVALPTEGAPPQDAEQVHWLNGRLWYLGDTVTALHPCTNSWQSLPDTGRPKEMMGRAFWQSSIIVGAAGKLVLIEQGGVAIIDERGWRVIAAKIPRQPVVATTDREVLIWGGSRDQRTDNGMTVVQTVGTGVRIDPVQATATPITTTGAPSPRTGTQGVWTGKQLFIWGGIAQPNAGDGCDSNGGCTLVGDGALYDPQADKWTPIASRGAPLGRTLAGVALLGSRVIVFGGWSYYAVKGGGSTRLYDGGIYDPQAGRWEPISDASELFQGGYAADPQAKSWKPISDALGPFRGQYASEILPAQSALVVPTFPDGVRYDLARRTWSLLPPTRYVELSMFAFGRLASAWGRPGGPALWYADGNGFGVLRFDAEAAIWQEAKLPNSALHHGHDTAWAGDRLVVWRTWIQAPDPGGDNGCRHPHPGMACDPVVPMKLVKRPAGAMIIPVWRNRPVDKAGWLRVHVDGGSMALCGALAALVGIAFALRRRRRRHSLDRSQD